MCFLQVVSTSDVTSKLVGNSAEVIQLYRYPGLAEAAASTLLHKVSGVLMRCHIQSNYGATFRMRGCIFGCILSGSLQAMVNSSGLVGTLQQ